MTSPFDFAKSIVQTKENLYDNEELFNKDYNPYMVNRVLSNSDRTCLFAEIMAKYMTSLDKKLQYDFYLLGMPKYGRMNMWTKKKEADINNDELEYVCSTLNVSPTRGAELYQLIGSDAIQEELKKRGGKIHGAKTKKM